MLAALLALSACDGATRMEVPPAEDVDVRIALFNVRELSTAKIAEVAAADPYLIHIKAFSLPPQEKKLVLDTKGVIALGEALAKGWLDHE